MTKATRQLVLEKYHGRCAFCGKVIDLKSMQVDHIQAVKNGGKGDLDNLNPACRSCNHYKRAMGLEAFRESMKSLHERVAKIYICKVAADHGVVTIKPFDKFYFEKETNQ